jgi:hypothetical protein
VPAVTVDARKLYYATDQGLYVARLPAHGSTAAPPNDDFENATVLRGPLPLHVEGTVGHATRQPGEPQYGPGTGTIWYRFLPAVTQRINVDIGLGGEWLSPVILTGNQLDALTRPPYEAWNNRYTFDITAGTAYWIVLSAFAPDYIPFEITISSA